MSTQQICIDLRGLTDRQLDAIRTMIVGDVLRRLLGHAARQPIPIIVVGTGGIPTGSTARELGLTPIQHLDSDQDVPHLVIDRHVVVIRPGLPTGMDRRESSRLVRVGAVMAPDSNCLDQVEPLAVKLALLRFPPASPAKLSAARLHRAAATLDRWRFKVAGWKDQPPAAPTGIPLLQALLADDLGTDAALRALHRIESDHTIPSGSKYSTFTEIDKVLALDLRRKCGYGHWS